MAVAIVIVNYGCLYIFAGERQPDDGLRPVRNRGTVSRQASPCRPPEAAGINERELLAESAQSLLFAAMRE